MAKLNPLILALGIPVGVIGFVAAVLVTRSGGKFGDLPQFSPDAYRKDWATLQGNAYVLACPVDRQLAFTEGQARILAVKPVDPSRGGGTLPVRVPASIEANFESGQRYNLKLRVRRDILEVEDLESF